MKKKWSRLKITVRGYKTWKSSMESIFSTSKVPQRKAILNQLSKA